MITEKYMKIIDQCEQRITELNEWEQGFILGETGNSKKPPLRERTFLSSAQKNILDRVVVQRFEGGKWDKYNIQIDYGDISANRTNEGWIVTVGGHEIGTGMVRKEVPIITAWLDGALSALLNIPREAFANYLNKEGGTEPEQKAELNQIIDGDVEVEEAEPF